MVDTVVISREVEVPTQCAGCSPVMWTCFFLDKSDYRNEDKGHCLLDNVIVNDYTRPPCQKKG